MARSGWNGTTENPVFVTGQPIRRAAMVVPSALAGKRGEG